MIFWCLPLHSVKEKLIKNHYYIVFYTWKKLYGLKLLFTFKMKCWTCICACIFFYGKSMALLKKNGFTFSMVNTIIHKHKRILKILVIFYIFSSSIFRIFLSSSASFLCRLHSIALLLFPIPSDTFQIAHNDRSIHILQHTCSSALPEI